MTDLKGQGQLGWAIGLMLFANLLFAVVDTSTKWLIGAGLFALQLAFARYFVHFLIALVDLRRPQTQTVPLGGRLWMLVTLRAGCIIGGTVANFIALGHLSLAVSSAILNLAPLLVCLLSGLILKERLSGAMWFAIIIGFGGVLVIIRPFGADLNWYAVLMLVPAVLFALYAILTRQLAGQISPARMQFATGVLGSIVLCPAAILYWKTPATLLEWTLYIGIGAIAWAGHEALTRAHAYAPASTLMPFGYAFVIYLSFAGWLVFGTIPDLPTILGAIVIVAAGLMIWRLQNQSITQKT